MVKQNNEIWTRGTRKSSVARIRLCSGNGKLMVNGKSIDDFFAGHHRQKTEVMKPLAVAGHTNDYDIIATVSGGGVTGQSGALRLGIARAIVQMDDKTKQPLRSRGFFTRDSRMVERKKPGQPKARKKFQYSKR
ncbi:MAG: 30S ribosomal protein S9 [bacterium]